MREASVILIPVRNVGVDYVNVADDMADLWDVAIIRLAGTIEK